MKKALSTLAFVWLTTQLFAVDLLSPSDSIIPIDQDGFSFRSRYPAGEPPSSVADQNSTTKYLNYGGVNSGFIVTPGFGSSTVRSITFTTANDAPERDPASFILWGTNEAITSVDNSSGQSENWFLIAFGELTLPDARLAMSDWLSFTNHNSFSSYRLVFPTLKNDGDSMQIADVALYTGVGGGGSSIVVYDSALAIHMGSNESFSPAAEPASSAIDGDVNTKYLNYGRENSGFIVTPSRGPSIVTGFTMSTANDHEGRDPASWTLFGTNERIVTTNHGSGLDETWKEIASGTLALPSERFTTSGPTPLANTRSFSSYKFLVRTVKDGGENSMQLAEIQLDGEFVVPPLITAFVHHQIDNKFTLTWRSNASASYSIFFSTDLIQWKRNNVGSIAGATDGETTTFGPFAIARAQGQQFPQTVFFRVAND